MRATRTVATDEHPPLARDAHGNMLPIPDGTAAWRLMRQTGGRPRIVNGPDGQPFRFPLNLDTEALAEMCGSGTYRVYALDEVGNQLDYVNTVTAGVDAPTTETLVPLRNASASPSSSPTDLRFALETIDHMGRTYADALRAVTEAQADWVKTIAMAKGLPRNVALPAPRREVHDDDDDEDDDDDGDDDVVAASAPQSGVEAFLAHLGPLLPEFLAMMRSSYPKPVINEDAPPPQPRNADSAAPAGGGMVHLANIQARLSTRERRFLDGLLTDEAAAQIARELNRRSVDDAVAFIRENIDADHGAANSDAPAATHAEHASSQLDSAVKHKLFAAAALLGPEERARLLALKPRMIADAGLIAEVSALFGSMTPQEVARWLKRNLDQLEARFST